MTPRASVAAIAIASGLIGGAASAATFTNPSGASVTFYGQLTPTFMHTDDGKKSYDIGTDNDAGNSRVGFDIKVPQGENQLDFWFESALGFRTNSSNSQSSPQANYMDWTRASIRHLELMYTVKNVGKFYAGQGSMATDGAAEQDFSNTGLAGESVMSDQGGAYFFRTKSDELSNVAITGAYNDFDGGRLMRVRYDTPNLLSGNNSLTFAAAYGKKVLTSTEASQNDDKYYDAAVRYGYEDAALKIGASAGYSVQDYVQPGEDNKDAAMFSAAILHKPTGLSLALTHSKLVNDGTDLDSKYDYAKLGWQTKGLIGSGTSAFSVDYAHGQDFKTDGSDSHAVGVQFVQSWDQQVGKEVVKTSAFLGWRKYSYNDDTANYKDINVVTAGMQFKF